MTQPLTVVELSQYEASQFIIFQKHRALIGLLESIGAFDLRSGSVTIHFDHLGQVGGIDKQQHFRQ